MPQISLSWDLFIVAFFAIVMSWCFIVGKKQSVKIIVAVYIAAIAVGGIGAVAARLGASEGMLLAGTPIDPPMLALGQIFLLGLFILVFLIRSGIEITYEKENGSILSIIATGLFGFTASGLIVSVILSYASQTTLPGLPGIPPAGSASLTEIFLQSKEIWYALPAMTIVLLSFLRGE